MDKTINLFIFAVQVALTFIVTFCVYMVFALLDSNFGFDGIFGLIFLQPIIAIILSGATIFFCLIIGLPIRFNKKLNFWWRTNYYISIFGTILGLIFLFLALLPAFKETVYLNDNTETTFKQIPNTLGFIFGWFLTCFFSLHIYPSQKLIKKVKIILEKQPK